jgi:hypothetical protein
MKFSKPDAISSLLKGTHYHIDGNLDIHYYDNQTALTEAEIDAEIVRLEKEYSDNEYARNRATEYPALAEQLDEIFHNGIDSWKALIKVTKDKYPKG